MNKNFLNNPTDALGDGLNKIRKEAMNKFSTDKKDTSANLKGKEEAKEADSARQDFITVREQNLAGAEGKDANGKGGLGFPS